MNHDPSLTHNGEIDALEFFTRLTTYYEQHAVSQQQKQDLQQGKRGKFRGAFIVSSLLTHILKP